MNCGGLWSQNMCPALHQENDGLNDSVTVIKKHQHHVIKLAFKHTSSSRQLPGGEVFHGRVTVLVRRSLQMRAFSKALVLTFMNMGVRMAFGPHTANRGGG